jgi:WASH complex subunit strumpellin
VNQDGKQLIAEALYLYGVMLLLLDLKIPGIIRERMLMSYYRYMGAGEIPNIDEVCKMCRNTGYLPPQMEALESPKDKKLRIKTYNLETYPLEYFARFPLPENVISMIVGRLRSDDIYLQTSYYPLPQHRSVALANQAGMLYVILFFMPNILLKEEAVMREIVDKHFPDNWVISYYMGFTVDLSVVWQNFKAASMAIKNTIQLNLVKDLAVKHIEHLKTLITEVNGFLTEGFLTEEYILDNINKLLSCLRNCNVCLRWLILHRKSEQKKIRDIVVDPKIGADPEEVLLLLLNTAQFEYVLKNIFQELLDQKEAKWTGCKDQAKKRMSELADYFSGERALATEQKDEQLQTWFNNIASKIDELDYHDSTLAGRRIQQLNTALEEVEDFHQIEDSLQVKQFLSDTRLLLKKMIRYVNIKESVLVSIATISDVSYSWEIVNDYVDSMQARIKKDPGLIIKIRSTFLKLASMLELPLVRISQAKSTDIVSVSQYYSSELVAFVRKTLEIIPMSMFTILNKIISIQTNKLRELPTRLPRDQLKEFAQLDDRYELARATYEVSKYTEGILAMETTLMGVVEVDPKQLLEDGIRKELVRQIAVALEEQLVFKTGKLQDFEEKLRALGAKLQGMLRSFEYIQDYVNVYGLKIWQEEFSRIINYYVEQECNRFLKRKVFDFQSLYQSNVIPIPKFKPLDDKANNFMGRLVNEILLQTDSKKTTYVDMMTGWFDQPGNEVVGINTFSLLHTSIGTFGLTGIDTLLSFINVTCLDRLIKDYHTDVVKNLAVKKELDQFVQFAGPPSRLPSNMLKSYPLCISKLTKLWPLLEATVIKLGRIQLVRRHIASELNFSCKLNANVLSLALDAMNKSLLNDIHEHFRVPDKKPHPTHGNPLLPELAQYLETAGMSNPIEKIYITSEPLPHVGLVLFLFVIAHLPRLTYNKDIDCIVSKKRDDQLDGVPFVVGLVTILRQFHRTEREFFLAYMGQYVRSNVDVLNVDKKNVEMPENVQLVLRLLQMFCKYSGTTTDKAIESFIPSYLFARSNH